MPLARKISSSKKKILRIYGSEFYFLYVERCHCSFVGVRKMRISKLESENGPSKIHLISFAHRASQEDLRINTWTTYSKRSLCGPFYWNLTGVRLLERSNSKALSCSNRQIAFWKLPDVRSVINDSCDIYSAESLQILIFYDTCRTTRKYMYREHL